MGSDHRRDQGRTLRQRRDGGAHGPARKAAGRTLHTEDRDEACAGGQDGHGDLATARAAARTGVPMVISTLTEDPMEDIAAEFGDTPGFFQLYTPADRDLAARQRLVTATNGLLGSKVQLQTKRF